MNPNSRPSLPILPILPPLYTPRLDPFSGSSTPRSRSDIPSTPTTPTGDNDPDDILPLIISVDEPWGFPVYSPSKRPRSITSLSHNRTHKHSQPRDHPRPHSRPSPDPKRSRVESPPQDLSTSSSPSLPQESRAPLAMSSSDSFRRKVVVLGSPSVGRSTCISYDIQLTLRQNIPHSTIHCPSLLQRLVLPHHREHLAQDRLIRRR
jgi:hypothetical protein